MRGLPAPGLRLALIFAIALASFVTPGAARAWTDATVRTARAEVELTADGRAHVTLWARVRVDGGWLEGMELEGLDEDAALDPEHPLTFRDASGLALPVEVTPRDGGRVSLRFARRTAPRRGEYDIDLAWTTSLLETRALDATTLEAHWVFPAWRYGLDAVEIRWIAPAGSEPQPEDEITAPIEIVTGPVHDTPLLGSALDHGEQAERISIAYQRAHLPRTSDWDTVVRVPRTLWPHVASDQLDAEPTPAQTRSAIEGETSVGASPSPASDPACPSRTRWWILCSLLGVAALIKRGDLDARARRSRQSFRWLLATPRIVHVILALATAVVGALTYALGWDASLCLIASALLVLATWQRAALDAPRPRVMPLSPVANAERLRAERARYVDWLGPGAWVEPTRLGLLSAAGAMSIALESDAPARLLGACFVALVVSGSRARLAPSSDDALRRLSGVVRQLRVALDAPYVSVRLLGRGASEPSDARVHVSLSDEGARARLLADLRVEIVATESLALRIAAREETPVELALRAWAESEGVAVHDIARRRAVLVPVTTGEVGPTLDRMVRGILALAPRAEDATVRDEALLDAAE